MKISFYMAALATVMAVPALAQETYENAKIATEDLNGTARYVGMGGAMDALGADISTIGTNPAGIGLFRKSNISLSAGMVSQQDAKNFGGGHTTNVSFDQVGFVWTNQTSSTNFVNFAFNYHKSRNFNQILEAADVLDHASQNKLTYAKDKNDLLFKYDNKDRPDLENPYVQCNQLDDMYYRNMIYQPGHPMGDWGYYEGDAYTMNRSHTGYISEFDFNLSGNSKNTLYWGLTLGFHDVHYKHYGEYAEHLIGDDVTFPKSFDLTVGDDRSITGYGFDVKLGVIVRPIEESPFRFGITVATPTWYDLKTSNYTTMACYGQNFSNGSVYKGGSVSANESYKFRVNTPWKFGISAGHTIGTELAMGIGYEFSDYSKLDSRYKTEGRYDWYYDTYSESSESDEAMNRHTSKTLKGVSTLKVGFEYKPDPAVAIRLGYNYVSPMYSKDGFKDGTIASEGSYYSSATDYTNWDSTERLTCGIGIQMDKWNFAAAYQYSTQKGNFSPFMAYEDNTSRADDNIAREVSVKNQRHQLLFTVGYTF